MNDAHAFVGIEIPRATVEALGGFQRAIERSVKAEGGTSRAIPKRVLALPLDDLGVVRGPALEAAELAMKHGARGHGPFSVRLGEIDAQAIEGGLIARIGIDDAKGRLAALRADVHRWLDRYGFPVQDGDWQPHVPLARIEGMGALPEVDLRGGTGTLRVGRVVLFRRRPDPRPARFRPVAVRPLVTATEADDGLDDEALRAEIAEALDARLTRRMQEMKTTKARRKRRRAG